MRKFFCVITIITTLLLSYISQQIKLLEYSYSIHKNSKNLCLLIDQNKSLRYNVANLESPVNLEQKLQYDNTELGVPGNWHYIRLAKAQPNQAEINKAAYDGSFKIAAKVLLNIFTPKAEAIAQELGQP